MAEKAKFEAILAATPGRVLSLAVFLDSIRGTGHEVFGRLIRHEVRLRAMSALAWMEVLEDLKGRPAHPSDPKFKR